MRAGEPWLSIAAKSRGCQFGRFESSVIGYQLSAFRSTTERTEATEKDTSAFLCELCGLCGEFPLGLTLRRAVKAPYLTSKKGIIIVCEVPP
jgi:hypothetical protein